MDHADRVGRLMAEREHPLLVTSLVNIRYLTGFTGSNAFFLVTPERNVFVTDGRYGEMAAELVDRLPAAELVVYTSGLDETLAGVVGDTADLDLEAEDVSWSFVRTIGDHVPAVLHATKGVVEALRRIKDDGEVDALRRAAAAGDAAFAMIEELAARSATEGDLGHALVEAMRDAGGEAADWPPIVASGRNAARPHHRAGHEAIGDGLLLVDYGCVVGGYHSDMTRTVWRNGAPDPEMARVHAAVLESNEAGIAAIGPGVKAHDVDEACRQVLRTHGYEEHFLHSTGHGVGLEIHEAPWVRRNSEDVLEVGNVVTVEPGVYLPGVGGVRIEDMVLVSERGPIVLTASSKDMLPG